MTAYRVPTNPQRGQLFWLELVEFPDRAKVVVRVSRVQGMPAGRVQVDLVGGDLTVLVIDQNRLLEELP